MCASEYCEEDHDWEMMEHVFVRLSLHRPSSTRSEHLIWQGYAEDSAVDTSHGKITYTIAILFTLELGPVLNLGSVPFL